MTRYVKVLILREINNNLFNSFNFPLHNHCTIVLYVYLYEEIRWHQLSNQIHIQMIYKEKGELFMFTDGIFQFTLFFATFLCSLVAGFLFAFAVVVMPGIRSLNDREFIRAFQVIDGVIQNSQPLFVLVWVGSVVALVVSAVLGAGQLDGTGRLLIIFATLAYIFGVQLPTVTINVPLNNKLQTLDVDTMDQTTQKEARKEFESRWNRWNSIRTVIASVVSFILIILLFSI